MQKPTLGPGLSRSDTALSGKLAPQFHLGNDGRSDDRVGYRFALLCEAGFGAALTQQHRAEMAAVGVAVLHSGEAAGLEAWLSEQGLKAALVRPDRYILGTARRDEDVRTLFSALTLTPSMPSAA